MLAEDIITKVRYTLSDPDADRWTDARLLSILNDGIIDIAKTTTLFIETMFYVVTNNVVDIDLSNYAIKIVRAEYLDVPLDILSFSEMEEKNKKWQLEEGTTVKALVYDNQKRCLLKQYPIVSNAYNSNIEYSSLFGITTDISYSDIAPEVSEVFGDISHIADEAVIKLYYVRKHATITSLTDELYIDELIEKPLKHYICGIAFRDNLDSQNRAFGNEELQYYAKCIDEYNIEKAQLFVRAQHEARYRPND